MSQRQEMLLKSHPPTANLLGEVCSPALPSRSWRRGDPGRGEKVGRRKGRVLALTAPPSLPSPREPRTGNFPSPSRPSPSFSVWSFVLPRAFGLTVKAPCSLRSPGLGFHYLSPEHELPQPPCRTCCSGCLAALAFAVPTAPLSRTLGSLTQSYLHAESSPGLLSHHLVLTCHNTSCISPYFRTESQSVFPPR